MDNILTSQTLVFDKPGQVSIHATPIPPPGPGQVRVRSIVSAISAGTEMLLFRGQMPADATLDATIPGMQQPAQYPLTYGYAVVGRVEQIGPGVDSAWQDRLVFVFHPHQSLFLAGVEHLLPVPSDVSADVAAMLPSMETAVNLVMDGQPLIGEHVLILGQGVVGLMVTTLLSSFPLAKLIVADYHEPRRQLALQLGADESVSPDELAATMEDSKVDLCYELSGNPDALNVAIAHTGYTGRVVIGSWYGRKTAPLSLGGSFHRSRIRLISSQVSRLDPRWTGRWTKERRIQTAWRMLHQVQAHRLITRKFPIEQASLAYQLLDQQPDQAIQLLIDYSHLADVVL